MPRGGRDRERVLSEEVLKETPEGREMLRTTLSFRAGGINYYSYRTQPRGYYVTVLPFRTEVSAGLNVEIFTLGAGRGALVAEAKAFSAKRLAEMTVDEGVIAELRAAVLADRAKET